MSGRPEGGGVRLGEEEEERRKGEKQVEEETTGRLSLSIFSVAFYPPVHRIHNPHTPWLKESRTVNLD